MELLTVISLGIGLLVVASSLVVAFNQNLLRSAFAMFGALFGVGALYATLQADFLAMVQILVYAGGICVLFIFGTMFTKEVTEDPERSNPSYQNLFPYIAIVIIACFMIFCLQDAQWAEGSRWALDSTVKDLGRRLLTDYLLPFEVVSFLLLTSLIGAMALILQGGKK
ncbi:MAG: NADH-quinone oxidoreductase subunit J [Planctomycetes bacterium]|nr:NADH-quinone oxidoreductase subunit J [Planctomycetota bacterium]